MLMLHDQPQRYATSPRPWLALLPLVLALPTPALPEGDLQPSWIEILPFSSWSSRVVMLSSEDPLAVQHDEEGAALVCTGGSGLAVTCKERYLHPEEQLEVPETQPGVRVTGRVLVNEEPASGTRISVAIAGLAARRPLLLPLRVEDGEVLRELKTDAQGRFSTPPLAAATYRLELAPPGGRIELLEPFLVPPPEDLVDEKNASKSASLPVLDLGDLRATPGLTVEVYVIDEEATPLAGAVVAASQGKPPGRVHMFQSRTDAEGKAHLHGFAPTGPIQASCSSPGFSRREIELEAPPSWIECVLQPLAWLTGEVLSGGDLLAGVTVTLEGRDGQTTTDEEGRFQFRDLDAGEYRLVAAMPGYEMAEHSGVLSPGEKGSEIIELEPAPLRWGRVIDAASGEPVVGARVASIAPAGAVAGTSDSEGMIHFRAPSRQRMMLEVTARGYPPHRRELGPEDGTEDEPWLVELESPPL